MERSRKKKYSVTQMMLVVMQLFPIKREGRVRGRLKRASIGAPTLENQISI